MAERDIFEAALAITDPAKRAAYLDQACSGDASLREHIEGLLGAQDQMGSFLEGLCAATIPMARSINQCPGPLSRRFSLGLSPREPVQRCSHRNRV
jgi:hypothetical protein